MKKTGKKINIVTHDQSFHADDVFSVAILSLLNKGNINVTRTRDPKLIEKADFVLDVGGINNGKTYFDHHQKGGAGERTNGAPFATLGLVWKKFGPKLCGSRKASDIIEEKLVYFIDTQDNGVNSFKATKNFLPYTISDMIASFNPTWQEHGDYDKPFKRAVEVAETILLREIAGAKARIAAEKFLKQAYTKSKDKRVIILNKNYSWRNSMSGYKDTLFVVYPKGDLWRVQAVRKNNSSFDLKKPFPKKWGGKMGEELAKISGVSDATFCHRKLFLVVAKSKTGALKLAGEALEK